ncbi:hypothetical protein IFM89_001046 [Coptis chinensis]|uniref:Uncharacterized protein n=1 Tax=Coptis chinensis TaxID=261450 RepID=A0A835HA71_9MAGN|nr:hypothetical protein IFM89_001046 [Coptis chinensis]
MDLSEFERPMTMNKEAPSKGNPPELITVTTPSVATIRSSNVDAHEGTSGTKDSNSEFINTPVAAQPRDDNVIEVEKEALQSNRADTEDTYGGVHTSKNTQASHLGDGNATDKEQSGSVEGSGQAETIRATDAVPLLALDGGPEAAPPSALVVFQAARENDFSVYASSDSMNLDRVEADVASSLPITPNRFRALEEADTLLQGNWADQVDEWQVNSRKGYKPQWQVQELTAPNTRAKINTAKQK